MRMSDLPLIEDVKGEYIVLRRRGESRADAVQSIINSYQDELSDYHDCDDALQVWIGLADGMYSNKELTSEIAEKGIAALQALEATDWPVAPGDIARRKDRYAKAPMPERNMSRIRGPFRCSWAIGDTYALHITDPKAQEWGLLGKYALLRKVPEEELWDGRVVPIVTITIWDALPLPQTADDFQKAPILKLRGPIMEMLPGQYRYRATFFVRSKKQLERLSLQWVGNFHTPMPKDEYVFSDIGDMPMIKDLIDGIILSWKLHQRYTEQEHSRK